MNKSIALCAVTSIYLIASPFLFASHGKDGSKGVFRLTSQRIDPRVEELEKLLTQTAKVMPPLGKKEANESTVKVSAVTNASLQDETKEQTDSLLKEWQAQGYTYDSSKNLRKFKNANEDVHAFDRKGTRQVIAYLLNSVDGAHRTQLRNILAKFGEIEATALHVFDRSSSIRGDDKILIHLKGTDRVIVISMKYVHA